MSEEVTRGFVVYNPIDELFIASANVETTQNTSIKWSDSDKYCVYEYDELYGDDNLIFIDDFITPDVIIDCGMINDNIHEFIRYRSACHRKEVDSWVIVPVNIVGDVDDGVHDGTKVTDFDWGLAFTIGEYREEVSWRLLEKK